MVPFGMQIRRNAETKGREVKYQVKEATMVNDREVERDAGVDLLYSRDDAVAMCRALKIVNGGNYFVEQVEPNEYDVAAEGLGLSGWDVMTRVRSVKADGMQKLVDALDSEYAPMAALGFVGTDRRWSVDYMAAVSLLKSIAVGPGSNGERALAYLLLYFYNDDLARRLGCSLDPLSAYRILDAELQMAVKPLFNYRLEEKERLR